MALLGAFTPFHVEDGDFIFRVSTRAGLKLPTGDASRLKEEVEESSEEHSERSPIEDIVKHGEEEHEGQIASVFHGHDLALGSALSITSWGQGHCFRRAVSSARSIFSTPFVLKGKSITGTPTISSGTWDRVPIST